MNDVAAPHDNPPTERVPDLAALAERLRIVGALIVVRPEASAIDLTTVFGAAAPASVLWRRGEHRVTVTQPLPVTSDPVTVARLNALLPAPALVLSLDSGALAYRAVLFTATDGALDVGPFDDLIAALVADVTRIVAALDPSDDEDEGDGEDGLANQLWIGYSE